jgi:hypothetical protein
MCISTTTIIGLSDECCIRISGSKPRRTTHICLSSRISSCKSSGVQRGYVVVRSLVSSGEGLAQWWAEDVVADPGADVVESGFFDRATVYRLRKLALLSLPEVIVAGTYRPRRRNEVGLLEVHVPRFLLETCSTAEEARHVLAEVPQFYITVPCLYLIADRRGDAFVWAHAARPDRPVRIVSLSSRGCPEGIRRWSRRVLSSIFGGGGCHIGVSGARARPVLSAAHPRRYSRQRRGPFTDRRA